MSLRITGHVSLPYIKPHQKRINKLMTQKSTIVSDIASHLTKKDIHSLQGTYLNAIFSTPTSIAKPTVSDITAIHLIDQSGLVVAEKKINKVQTEAHIYELIDKMVLDLPRKGYKVIIETIRDGVQVRNDVEVNATHAMEAIPTAILTLASEVYNDLPSEGYKTTVIDSIKKAVFSLDDIIVEMDNGCTYKLLAVAKYPRYPHEFKNTTLSRSK